VFCPRSGSCARWREHKELVVGSRGAEEGVEIHQDVGGEFGGTRRMVDDQPGLIRENEWGGGFGEALVLASFREASNPCREQRCSSVTMSMMCFLLHQNSRLQPKCSIAQCRK
jgi:hypothetical protein